MAPSSSGLGRRPLKAVAWVQIPSGLRRRSSARVEDLSRFRVSSAVRGRAGWVVSPAARGRLRFESLSVSNLVSEVSRLRRDLECLVQIPSGLRRRSSARAEDLSRSWRDCRTVQILWSLESRQRCGGFAAKRFTNTTRGGAFQRNRRKGNPGFTYTKQDSRVMYR